MITIDQLITGERVASEVDVSSKKRGLEVLSELIAGASPALESKAVFDRLVSREKLGSTGLGRGVALPHARMDGADGAVAAFIHTREAIDFDAFDGEPVDLFFALVVPEHFNDEHLQILARLAEMFSEPDFCRQLRDTEDADALYRLLTTWESGEGNP